MLPKTVQINQEALSGFVVCLKISRRYGRIQMILMMPDIYPNIWSIVIR